MTMRHLNKGAMNWMNFILYCVRKIGLRISVTSLFTCSMCDFYDNL